MTLRSAGPEETTQSWYSRAGNLLFRKDDEFPWTFTPLRVSTSKYGLCVPWPRLKKIEECCIWPRGKSVSMNRCLGGTPDWECTSRRRAVELSWVPIRWFVLQKPVRRLWSCSRRTCSWGGLWSSGTPKRFSPFTWWGKQLWVWQIVSFFRTRAVRWSCPEDNPSWNPKFIQCWLFPASSPQSSGYPRPSLDWLDPGWLPRRVWDLSTTLSYYKAL